MSKIADNFCGLNKELSDYGKSKAVLMPVPYEATTTYLKGTRNAPGAIIGASKYLELYDEELDRVIAEIGISTLAPFKTRSKPEAMVNKLKAHCFKILKDNKFPILLGGEHSISVGFLFALKQKYPDISVLQFDAHADMRDEYKGSKYNHACVMARIREHCNAVGVGIRSLSYEEAESIKKNDYKILWAKDKTNIADWTEEILRNLSRDVFITVDVDVIDPSLLPSVGTPEPGGLDWYEILAVTQSVFKKKNVVGFDIVELRPNPADKASDFTVAKLIYKMLGYRFYL